MSPPEKVTKGTAMSSEFESILKFAPHTFFAFREKKWFGQNIPKLYFVRSETLFLDYFRSLFKNFFSENLM